MLENMVGGQGLLVGHTLPVLSPAGLPEGCTVPSHGVPWSSPWSFGHSVSSRWWTDRPRGMHGTGMGVEPFDCEWLDEWTSTRSGDEKDRVWRLQRPRLGRGQRAAKRGCCPYDGILSLGTCRWRSRSAALRVPSQLSVFHFGYELGELHHHPLPRFCLLLSWRKHSL